MRVYAKEVELIMRGEELKGRKTYKSRVDPASILDALVVLQELCQRGWSHQRQFNPLTGKVLSAFFVKP